MDTIELAVDVHAEVAQLRHFFEERDRVENHAVADDALAALAQHPAGDQLQDKLLPADDDRVPGVVAAGITRHGAEALAEHVHNLPFALVAPLGAQHYRRLRSHRNPVLKRMARRGSPGFDPRALCAQAITRRVPGDRTT